MTKLLKYEFIKIRAAALIVFGAVAALELMYVIGAVLMKYNSFEEFDGNFEKYTESTSYILYSLGQQMFTFAVILLLIACFSSAVFVIIFSLVTMNNDFCKKQGYNVFLTPNSSYTILGAKYITAFLIFAIYAAICFLLIILDFNVANWLYDYEYIQIFEDIIKPILEETGINFTIMFIAVIAQLLYYIVLAGFTLILAQTMMKSSGALKVLIEFGVYIAVNSAVSGVMMIPTIISMNNINVDDVSDGLNTIYLITALGYGLVIALLYYFSARLIDKKLSL